MVNLSDNIIFKTMNKNIPSYSNLYHYYENTGFLGINLYCCV